MRDRIEFDRVADSLRCGREVDDGELLDAWNYAADGVNEIYRLGKSLMEGYREQARVIRRMEELLMEKDRQIKEKSRLIWVLNRKLQGAAPGQEAAHGFAADREAILRMIREMPNEELEDMICKALDDSGIPYQRGTEG